MGGGRGGEHGATGAMGGEVSSRLQPDQPESSTTSSRSLAGNPLMDSARQPGPDPAGPMDRMSTWTGYSIRLQLFLGQRLYRLSSDYELSWIETKGQ